MNTPKAPVAPGGGGRPPPPPPRPPVHQALMTDQQRNGYSRVYLGLWDYDVFAARENASKTRGSRSKTLKARTR